MKVAVDAMGGDNAPQVVVRGAVEAASEMGIDIILVGDKDVVGKELGPCLRENNISVHHCREVVKMEEAPLKAVRKKRDSSIRVAFDLVKKGDVDAVVSAGNSGATLAAGILTLGRLEGVERPAIASIFPGEQGDVVLIDVGANVDCRPSHLFQFGIMAQAFAGSCLAMESPRIGLLSIGEEGNKGNEQVKMTRKLFEQSRLNFVGNVEGRNVFTGDVDIIVCDGFVGNVALKIAEGVAEGMTKVLKDELAGSLRGRAAILLGRGALKKLRSRFNYEAFGGAPLLGINGVGIVCHGGSTPRAIKNAIFMAAKYVGKGVLEKMVYQLKNCDSDSTPLAKNEPAA